MQVMVAVWSGGGDGISVSFCQSQFWWQCGKWYCFYESSDRNNVLDKMVNYKNLFPTTIFMHVCDMDKLDDWEEMILMSCCHDHIISNSSFSWWGAYLNETPSKCVVYPSLWFGKALSNHDTKDLCPPEWTQLIS